MDIGRISEMEVAEPDGGKTAGLVVAILVGGAATVGLAFLALVFIMSGARF